MLILFSCRMDMAGGVDFSAANAKTSAQLRVKGKRNTTDRVHVLDSKETTRKPTGSEPVTPTHASLRWSTISTPLYIHDTVRAVRKRTALPES